MSPLVIAALAAIIAIQPSLPISSGEKYVTKETTVVNGQTVTVERSFTGFTTCEDGRVTRLVHNGRLDTFTHELLHAYDCIDGGGIDGSPLPYRPPSFDPGHQWTDWCLANESACIKILGQR